MLFDCLCNLLSAVQRKWVLCEPYSLSMNGIYNLLLCGPNGSVFGKRDLLAIFHVMKYDAKMWYVSSKI